MCVVLFNLLHILLHHIVLGWGSVLFVHCHHMIAPSALAALCLDLSLTIHMYVWVLFCFFFFFFREVYCEGFLLIVAPSVLTPEITLFGYFGYFPFFVVTVVVFFFFLSSLSSPPPVVQGQA